MPRALTEAERARVLQRLHARGRDRFVRLGLAKTTVAGLAADAGIGKGSFYLFYPSKEDLFLAISAAEEERFRSTLLSDVFAAPTGREAIALLLRACATRLQEQPFLRLLLDPSTLSSLVLRVDPERLRRNEDDDRAFFVRVAQDLISRGFIRGGIDPVEVFHALSGLFLIAVQRELLEPETADGAVDVIVAALCDRWSPP